MTLLADRASARAGPGVPTTRAVRATRAPLPLVLLTAAVALVAVAPLVLVVGRVLPLGWSGVAAYLLRPRMAELIANTTALVLITVPLTIVIGVGAAWLVERTTLPGAAAWRILLLAPLAVPAFVASYAWSSAWPSAIRIRTPARVWIALRVETPRATTDS